MRDHGHEPVAFVRQSDVDVPAEVLTGDLLDQASVARAVTRTGTVCHLAAATQVRDSFTDPLAYWYTNVTGTLNILQALANRAGPGRVDEPLTARPGRIVLASTAAVYGAPEQQPIDEDAPTAPTSPYGRSKLAADDAAADLARTGAIGAASLRAFNVAGAADGLPDPDRTRLIPKVLAVQAGLAPELAVNGDGSAVRDFVHASDMAEAFVLALEASEPGAWRAYNVGSGRQTQVSDVVRLAAEVTGKPVPVRHLSPVNEPSKLLADSTRIRAELGWQTKNSDLGQILSDGWSALTSQYARQE